MVDYDYHPPVDGDVGFNLPKEYVFKTAFWLREYGIMPEPGGLLDQDKLWADDMETYQRAYNAAWRDVQDERKFLDEMRRGR